MNFSRGVEGSLSHLWKFGSGGVTKFREKWSPSSFLPSIVACKKDEDDYFSRNFVCLLRTTKTRHKVSFIDVYFHFLANFQTYCPHMFSIFTHVIRNPYVTQNNSEPGLPVHLIEYHTSTYKWNYNNKLTDVINRTIRTSKEKKRTCCVIAGNRHYILDLKHNKKMLFFSYLSQTLKLRRN